MTNKLRFEEINLSKEIQKAVSDMGFEEMSPIQSGAIPAIMDGKDIIGQAQTGTGKTAAFGIPIIEKCDPKDRQVQALVLCPTRELSIQVSEEISRLAKYKKGVNVLPIYGGQPIDRQIRALKKGVNIVIGTPGRVLDHIRRKTLKLGGVNMMVLDEADEMFDMGFRDDIATVMNELSEKRQTVFFSATMPRTIINFASKYQNKPEVIKVVHQEMTVPEVEQAYFELKHHMKTEILTRLIDIYNPKLTIVFCNTKRKVDQLTDELSGRGYLADGLHGDLKQSQRDNVMNKFRKGTIEILVATDVAARGIDVEEVDLVINYDLPQDEEYYVHRIGRTARAGREGMAFSFVSGREIQKLKAIQRYTKTNIPRKELPTLKDIESNQTTSMLEKIKTEIDGNELGKYEKMIEEIIAEDYTSFDVAAALMKFYITENKLEGHQELDMVDYHSKSKSKTRSNTATRSNKGTSSGKSLKSNRGDTKRMYINAGKRRGISPRHVLGAIMGETDIDKNLIGDIDVYDKFTFVEVDKNTISDLVDKLDGVRIKGKKISAEIAKPKDR